MSTKTEYARNRAFRQDISCARCWAQHSCRGAALTVHTTAVVPCKTSEIMVLERSGAVNMLLLTGPYAKNNQ